MNRLTSVGARVASALTLLLAIAPRADAQRTFRTVGEDIWHVGTDVLGVIVSPVHADARDWLGAGAVVGASALASPYDDDIDRWIVSHPHSGLERGVHAFRERSGGGFSLAKLPLEQYVAAAMLPVYVAGFAADKPGLRDAATGCLASVYASGAVRTAVYSVVSRDRPRVRAVNVQGDQYEIKVPGGSWSHHSFFGGHVANAMGCASFLGSRFHLGVAEPLLYTYAAGVGIARIYDRNHWTSDTMLGAGFGLAIGRVVAHRSLARRDQRQREKNGETMNTSADSPGAARFGEPIFGQTSEGSVVGWRLRFR